MKLLIGHAIANGISVTSNKTKVYKNRTLVAVSIFYIVTEQIFIIFVCHMGRASMLQVPLRAQLESCIGLSRCDAMASDQTLIVASLIVVQK